MVVVILVYLCTSALLVVVVVFVVVGVLRFSCGCYVMWMRRSFCWGLVLSVVDFCVG